MTSSKLAPPAGSPWDDALDAASWVFVDLEMTGLDMSVDRVIEVCVERVVGARSEKPRASLTTLVRPSEERHGNEHIHGISRELLMSAPTFAELIPRIDELLRGAVLVAHGAKHDVGFLEAEFARAGRKLSIPFYLDTLTLSRRAFALDSHALASLATSLSLDTPRSHRAADDVRTLRQLFQRVVDELKPATPRDLWQVKIGNRAARALVVEALRQALTDQAPVRVRYRPSGKPAVDLVLVVTAMQWELDPPHVLGYLLPGRGRRELRADRILTVSPL